MSKALSARPATSPEICARAARIVATLVITLLTAPGALAQVHTGNLFGRVVDVQQKRVPGVTVTLSGIGAPQLFATDREGNFRFLALAPGRYELKTELEGFNTVRRAVDVNVALNAELVITLPPAMEETLTITAETPLLDVRKAVAGTNVSKVELEHVPSARDPWVVLQTVPGVLVDRVNIGGSESGQQSYFVGKGTYQEQTTWNMDGVNITDMIATGA